MASLGVCMIAKNEGSRLDACLGSIHGLVDEIILVDTGSTDNTIEIAKKYGAKVYEHPWENDFAKARNYSLDYSTTDWILILDADEVVNEKDLRKVRENLEKAEHDAYMIDHRDYTENFRVQGWRANDDCPECKATGHFITWNCRLFRNKGYKFIYPQHEVIEPSIKASGGRIGKMSIPIHHYGYMEESLGAKRDRIIAVGLKQIEKDPTNPRPRYETARVLYSVMV